MGGTVVDLKGLIHRELGEGLTETELATAVGVSLQTIKDILSDKPPQDPTIWEKFATHFRMDADFLRTGESTHPSTLVTLSEDDQHSRTIEMRKVPLLTWRQLDQMITSKDPSRVIRAGAMLEITDVPGKRTFALTVKDNAMHPLFSEGEIIIVNPDLKYKPGDYVVVGSQRGRSGGGMLRQLKKLGGQYILHPLSRKYGDLPLTKHERVHGKVVRLRKNL
jgi:SOS-response transcriptional repressor LexA